MTTTHRGGNPKGSGAGQVPGKLRDRQPRPITCKDGHQFTTRAMPGTAVRCPECRASTWVRKLPPKPPTRREIRQAQRQAEERERQRAADKAARKRQETYRRAADRARARNARRGTQETA